MQRKHSCRSRENAAFYLPLTLWSRKISQAKPEKGSRASQFLPCLQMKVASTKVLQTCLCYPPQVVSIGLVPPNTSPSWLPFHKIHPHPILREKSNLKNYSHPSKGCPLVPDQALVWAHLKTSCTACSLDSCCN